MRINSVNNASMTTQKFTAAKNESQQANSQVSTNAELKQVPLATMQGYSKIGFTGAADGVRKVADKMDINKATKQIIMLLGAPNSGKGTYSSKLSKMLNIPQISTGDIIRAEIKAKSELGLQAKAFSDSGKLAPDELILEMFNKRIKADDCKNGFILDGFPRTVPQAEALDKLLKKDKNASLKVMNLDVPEAVLFQRSANRMFCPDCSATPSLKTLKDPTVCPEPNCGGHLIKRADDTPEVLTKRLEEYHEKTEPLSAYYANQGLLKNVEMNATVEKDCNPEEVLANMIKNLKD